jgi:bifunctional non-homologous end joining protein LigD
MTDLQTPDYADMLPLPSPIREKLLLHYGRVAGWIAANFDHAPLVAEYYPHGLDGDEVYSGAWHHPLPATVPHIEVHTSSGVHLYPGCAENTVMWLVHKGAVGFGSWTPCANDAQSARYARMLIRPNPGCDENMARAAAKHVRAALKAFGLDGIPVLERRGVAVFIPFGDGPPYEQVRSFLRTVVARASAAAPDTIVPERKAHDPVANGRVEVTVRSNAPGRFSSLPYTLVGAPHLTMVTPISWEELDTAQVSNDSGDIRARLQLGDLFARMAKPLAKQLFASVAVDVR